MLAATATCNQYLPWSLSASIITSLWLLTTNWLVFSKTIFSERRDSKKEQLKIWISMRFPRNYTFCQGIWWWNGSRIKKTRDQILLRSVSLMNKGLAKPLLLSKCWSNTRKGLYLKIPTVTLSGPYVANFEAWRAWRNSTGTDSTFIPDTRELLTGNDACVLNHWLSFFVKRSDGKSFPSKTINLFLVWCHRHCISDTVPVTSCIQWHHRHCISDTVPVMSYPVLVWQIRCKVALWNAHTKSHKCCCLTH